MIRFNMQLLSLAQCLVRAAYKIIRSQISVQNLLSNWGRIQRVQREGDLHGIAVYLAKTSDILYPDAGPGSQCFWEAQVFQAHLDPNFQQMQQYDVQKLNIQDGWGQNSAQSLRPR